MRLTRCQTFAAALLLLGSLLTGACSHTLSGTENCSKPQPDPDRIELRYLGSGGIYLRWRQDAILVGPSFSNPNLVRARFLRVKPSDKRIGSALDGFEYQRVRAIFAGHSHYDHIADIPAVAERIIERVPVHVNAMGVLALAGEEGLQGRVHELVPGKTVEVGSIRVRPVVSGHAPQICKWRRFPCVYAGGAIPSGWTTPLKKHRLAAMHGGETLAFVIELYDGETERFRIYYNDASPDTPLGQTTGDFDLAILTIAQWNWARDYPRDLLSVLRPRHVVISHWDNFFKEASQTSRAVPFLTTKSVDRFKKIVEPYVTAEDGGPVGDVCGEKDRRWTMPAPMSTMFFNPR